MSGASGKGGLHVLRAFWPWIRTERRGIATSLVALLGGVVLRLAEPWPLKFVFDRVIPTSRPEGMNSLSFVDAMDPIRLLTLAAVAMVAITGVRAMCDYYQRIGLARIAIRVVRRIRNDVFLHVQRLSLSFHDKARTGDLVVRVTRDVSLLRDVASTALMPLVASLLILVGMVAVMLVLQWKLALLAMITVPFFVLATTKIGIGIRVAARKQRRREGEMASTAAESIAGIRDVQAMSLEHVFADDFSNRNARGQKEEMQATRLSAQLGRTIDALIAGASALVIWYGGVLVLRGQLTPGDLVVFMAYLKKTLKPAKEFAKYTGRLSKATAAGERVLALLTRAAGSDRPDAREAHAFEGSIRFDGVSFSYGPGAPILNGLDLEIPTGRLVALVGPSGAGKSTVASLLLRLYEPDRGAVSIDGHDAREFTAASVRTNVSVVLQDTILFAGSVAENIRAGTPDVDRRRVEEAARLAGAHRFIKALGDGYDTAVGERGASLSHGQRQRIAIARAALRRAPILVLDEPTTGLDAASRAEVVDALIRLARGATTVLITHDLELARLADRVAVLEDGRIVAHGPPPEVLPCVAATAIGERAFARKAEGSRHVP